MTTTRRMTDREQNQIRLQGIGLLAGKPAGEVQVGDKLMWNYGYTSIVRRILKQTAATIVVETECDGKLYERRMHKQRIVAVVGT